MPITLLVEVSATLSGADCREVESALATAAAGQRAAISKKSGGRRLAFLNVGRPLRLKEGGKGRGTVGLSGPSPYWCQAVSRASSSRAAVSHR